MTTWKPVSVGEMKYFQAAYIESSLTTIAVWNSKVLFIKEGILDTLSWMTSLMTAQASSLRKFLWSNWESFQFISRTSLKLTIFSHSSLVRKSKKSWKTSAWKVPPWFYLCRLYLHTISRLLYCSFSEIIQLISTPFSFKYSTIFLDIIPTISQHAGNFLNILPS